eukprot:scaffold39813_cov206-Amphora_coffeaeformis.AAC.3
MRSRTLDLSLNDEEIDTRKDLVHGFTWHTTTTEETAQESCTSFCSFGFDGDDDDEAELTKPMKTSKRVQFCEERNKVQEVESWREHSELWWDEEEMLIIRGDCNVVVREYRKRQDLVEDLSLMLAQGMTGANDSNLVKKFMSRMKKCDPVRGFERDVHPPCRNLSLYHYKCVFETQKKLREKNLWGTEVATKNLSKCTERSSKAFANLAVRLAQYDTREAMRAAFTFDDTAHPTFKRSKMSSGKVSRLASMEVKSNSLKSMPRVSRRASLSENRSPQTPPPTQPVTTNPREAMMKRAGGLDRRRLLAHTTSMRSVNSKYGSLGEM